MTRPESRSALFLGLAQAGPPPPGPVAQTGERLLGRAEGGGRREREQARGERLRSDAQARPLAGRCGVAAARTDAAG